MARRFLEVDQTLEWLIDEASHATIQRGQTYYFQKRVSRIQFQEDIYTGLVHGTQWYRFTIHANRQSAVCECRAEFPCKHLVAAVYAISIQKRLMAKSTEPDQLVNDDQLSGAILQQLVLVIDSHFHYRFMQRHPVSGKIHEISSFTDPLTLPGGQQIQPQIYDKNGRFLYFYHTPQFIENNSQFKELPRYFTDGLSMQYRGEILLHCRLVKNESNHEAVLIKDISIIENNKDKTSKQNNEYYLEYYYKDPQTGNDHVFQSQDYTSESFLNGLLVLIPRFTPDNSPEKNLSKMPEGKTHHYDYYALRLQYSQQSAFVQYQKGLHKLNGENLLQLQHVLKRAHVENIKNLIPEVFNQGPFTILSIYPEEGLRLKIRGRWEFVYTQIDKSFQDDETFETFFNSKNSDNYFANFEILNKRVNSRKTFEKGTNGNYAQLNIPEERKAVSRILDSSFFNGKKGGISLSPRRAREFVLEGADQLKSLGVKIRIHKSLTRLLSRENNMLVNFRINSEASGIDWFEGQIEGGGMSLREMRMALKAYRKKEEFVKLKDGNWVSLDMIGIKGLMESFEKLGIKIQADGSAKKMTRGEVMALTIEHESDTRTDMAVSELRNRIKQLPEKQKQHTEDFQTSFLGVMRDYQKEGILFLESLYEAGIGGILADDMGLGKTIQGLGFLSRLWSQKKDHGGIMLSLVVGPLASLSVWKKEAEKFFPDLQVTLWHGAGRTKSEFPKEGVLLTTYGTLLRDFEGWKNKHHFDVAILDEAQNLKNFRSLSSHAVRQTSVSVYFCLTGTPLENHLLDLWSLFDISFPGYLGNRASFLKYYQVGPLDYLRKKIEPFILRRTKSEVLKELPPITESLVPVTMTEKQRKFYEEARKLAIMELSMAKENYLMLMLPHLMKLRRIASHPEAGNPTEAVFETSGKFQYLKDTLPELEETSSGVLIFSQFTDILKICARLLDDLGFPYFYLDGKTPAGKRDTMVKKFQAGEHSFFLISLKAGGTALTLHRADTVIHLDPWWNPATERQASDRAHRIGQKKKVFVYKLYCENSIEEKVLELQNRKKEIFDSLFEEKMESAGKITREQIMKLLSE